MEDNSYIQEEEILRKPRAKDSITRKYFIKPLRAVPGYAVPVIRYDTQPPAKKALFITYIMSKNLIVELSGLLMSSQAVNEPRTLPLFDSYCDLSGIDIFLSFINSMYSKIYPYFL